MVGQRRWAALVMLLWLTTGCGGRPPLHEAAAYVRRAKSARITVYPKADGAEPREVEIVCPDRVRVAMNTPEGRLEIVAVGNRGYSRIGQQDWRNVPPWTANAPLLCQGARWRRGADLSRALTAMASLPATEGPTRAPLGIPCRVWTLHRKTPASKPQQLTQVDICFGTEDGRPVVLDAGAEIWVFTEWNGEIAIEEPEVGSSPASTPSPAPGTP